MRKISIVLLLVCALAFRSQAQLSFSKMVGNDSQRFGFGPGLFTYLDIPLARENQSFRVELLDLAIFVLKGENFFTSTAGGKAYASVKLGYKYVFSETQAGFYLLPSAGYCRAVNIKAGEDATYGDGIAGALEGGYSLEVGQKGHTLNFGLKYEYDRGNATHIVQSVGLRVSYAFGLFRKKEE